MEFDVTHIVLGEIEPMMISGSVAEHGPDASRITFANAKESMDGITLTEAQIDALRDHFRNYGAWDDEEIAAWSPDDLAGMLAQEVANEMRESGLPLNPQPADWKRHRKGAEDGRHHGALYPHGGRVYWTCD